MQGPVLDSTIPTVPIRTCHRMLHCYMYTIALNKGILKNIIMYRSLKMRIEPDSEQRKVIEASFRYHCYVYNALLLCIQRIDHCM